MLVAVLSIGLAFGAPAAMRLSAPMQSSFTLSDAKLSATFGATASDFALSVQTQFVDWHWILRQ
jgi:hypothetical protein